MNSSKYINLFLVTSNKWLANGVFSICDKISSCSAVNKINFETHHVDRINDLTTKLLSISGKVLVVFDSADYFPPKICSLIDELRRCGDNLKFIFLCRKNEMDLFRGAYNVHFDAVIDKCSSIDQVETTLCNVIKKNLQESTRNIIKYNNGISNYNPALKLTSREHMVMNDMFSGLKTKTIAQKLLVSEKKIYAYRSNIYSKMNVRSLNELYLLMMRV